MSARELFQKGDRIGEYEILSKLRAGGMATLFLGRRHGAAGVSRPVVIKVIHPHLAEDELIVRMFIDEAQISSHISHKNVVYVERFGEHDGVYFIVMEFVDGCSVDQLLRTMNRRGELLSPEVAVHIVIETASGLHAAHETLGTDGQPLNIVHRDVSPSNILLTRDGNIKVIDFGIAKARNRLNTTQDGSGLKGKLRYMSPEQAWGKNVDRSADVYALGVVLWELLTCKPLFKGTDDLAVLELVRNPEIPPPSRLNPSVPPALDGVVLRATARDPAQRLQTAQEFRRQLMHAVPTAVSIPEEAIPSLVTKVRETMGPSPTPSEPEDDKATTPNTPPRQTPPPGVDDADTAMLPPSPSAASSLRAAGEVQTAPIARIRSTGYLVFAAGVLVAGLVITLFALRGGGADQAEVQPSRPPVSTSTNRPPATPTASPVATPPSPLPATPPPVATPAMVSPPAIPGTAVGSARTPTAASTPARTPSKRVGKSSAEAAAQQPQAIDVDGSVLADETPQPKGKPLKPPPAKRKAPKRPVNVGGTVLSE
ncbi:MAG: protein kinase [Myxococcales bacterium]|nr:protein kinase [Myxococcales bacterium]